MLRNLYPIECETYKNPDEPQTSVPYEIPLPLSYLGDLSSFLLGARLRQLRTVNESCTVPEIMKDSFPSCLGSYSMYEQDEGDYRVGWRPVSEGEQPDPAFTYQSAYDLGGQPWELNFGTYSGGGYVADLGRDLVKAFNLTTHLEASNWLDRQTRVVFIELLAYNPATRLFTTVRGYVHHPCM